MKVSLQLQQYCPTTEAVNPNGKFDTTLAVILLRQSARSINGRPFYLDIALDYKTIRYNLHKRRLSTAFIVWCRERNDISNGKQTALLNRKVIRIVRPYLLYL
jgi:hypothetical protein